MAVELKALIKKVSNMDLTLLAGENGLDNMVSWVHMIETAEASSFLEGGEIAFTTGIGLSGSLTLLDLVRHIYDHGAAGIVFNVGPFLENIPSSVVDFGNSHDFPIFSIPWRIHLAEIMRIFTYEITRSEQAEYEAATAFRNAILFPAQEDLYTVPLATHGYEAEWNYYCGIICITDKKKNAVNGDELNKIGMRLENHLQHNHYKTFSIFCDTKREYLLAVTANYSEEEMEHFTEKIRTYLATYLPAGNGYTISIGRSAKSIRCLRRSCRQAESMQAFMKKSARAPHVLLYEKLGIYKLLLGVDDADILADFYEKTLKPLSDYDDQNGTDLTELLWTYLQHNGSVKETSEELFVHRNTVNYKLDRAEQVLAMDLSTLNTRVQLTLAFMIRDMM
ncbi:MAG: PucR family transcriptional regulator ligand-binding domain-containing protein [Lachnospiraceae bacterium]|nr:PucR family transcriptional regulator ligand-binding domain-containing protein [Lachnospiraceae bacterium]